jgi:phospholipid-transporting ATPase
MFSRVAYLYFLIQAGLSWWSVVSPYSGIGSTAALLFVLLVAGVKAVWEDMKRHQEDQRMNTSVTHRLTADGSVEDIPWTDVRVGDAIVVRDDENFPADLMCLRSALPDNVCFIRTTNLDGETNLKIRKPLDVKGLLLESTADVTSLDITLKTELPNKNLHKFKGAAVIRSDAFREMGFPPSQKALASLAEGGSAVVDDGSDALEDSLRAAAAQAANSGTPTTTATEKEQVEVAVTMNEMLLRGCTLKNSTEIVGLVVYTGKETRIQMNSTKTPLKIGSFDRFLNLQITLVIAMQLAMALFLAVANYIWVQNKGIDHFYLALTYHVEGVYANGFVQIVINFLTFWILLSYLVPISLFVTLEIVKFWQGFVFMNWDKDMRDPETGEFARCRNSNLNEDLGKIEYVFSDKTGTLTSNEMQLRQVSIKGQVLGSTSFRLEDHTSLEGLPALRRFDNKLARAARAVSNSTAWNSLVGGGGSQQKVMAYHHSNPSHGTADSLGLPHRQINLEDFDPSEEIPLGNTSPIAEEGDGDTSPTGVTFQLPDNNGGRGNGTDNTSAGTIQDRAAAARSAVTLGHHMVDFFTNICLCHSLILEADTTGGQPRYQGPSPDEVALVSAARQMGFVFKNRAQASITLEMLGKEVTYEVLNVMEYSSERGCMSVIARSPDGTVRLYCKGADTKVMKKIRSGTDAELTARTDSDLHTFAKRGLRTLVLASKVIPEEVYNDWDNRYQEASRTFEGRDAAMDTLGNEIELDLELIGVTAIEDKLQDGVPEAIKTLLDANIRVWMITGDKQETAVNIAVSCDLVRNVDDVIMLNVDEKAEGEAK